MPGFADHFSTKSSAYVRYRPSYPDELFEWLASVVEGRDRAWDLACGSGQVAVALARWFRRVDASDASRQQIAAALKSPGVEYHVAQAEQVAADDGTLDLVTVGQAVHWLDHEAFFPEVDRVLKSGGVFAVWGYQTASTDSVGVDEVFRDLEATVEGDWPPQRAILAAGYQGVAFPYPPVDPPPLELVAHWTLDHFLGYLGTWSAITRFERRTGRHPLAEVRSRLESAWGEPSRRRRIEWPLVTYFGRKPGLGGPGAGPEG